ncbi:MAG: AraC family transcriptional regulator [Acidobacteria bacterium]|nr:MAG: AraC family transcriptional regulator [Acidobacteriota bacterium]
MDKRVQAVLAIIDQNWNRGALKVSSLAQSVNLSTVRLQHLFKTATGKNIRAYIMDKRLTAAVNLLSKSNLTGKEVCHQVGFSNLPDFYRSFRKRFGTTPGAFRSASPTALTKRKTDLTKN